jgi:hypothetical protein
LREAVLEITAGEGLRRESLDKALDEFCSRLLKEDAESVREVATKIASWILDMPSAIRDRTEVTGKYGHSGGLGRLGFLKFIAELNRLNRSISVEDFKADFPEIGESLERWNSLLANEQALAKIAARSRTTTEVTANAVKTELEDGKLLWRFLVAVLLGLRRQRLGQALTLERVFGDWKTENNLDRHYSYELVTKLPQIVDRASVLSETTVEDAFCANFVLPILAVMRRLRLPRLQTQQLTDSVRFESVRFRPAPSAFSLVTHAESGSLHG